MHRELGERFVIHSALLSSDFKSTVNAWLHHEKQQYNSIHADDEKRRERRLLWRVVAERKDAIVCLTGDYTHASVDLSVTLSLLQSHIQPFTLLARASSTYRYILKCYRLSIRRGAVEKLPVKLVAMTRCQVLIHIISCCGQAINPPDFTAIE